MRIKLVSVSLCAAALAVTSAPASADQAQPNSGVEKKQAGQKKVCRFIERTGTRRAERICLTAEEWRKVDDFVARDL